MTTARSQVVDPTNSRWYHCISRCVRQAFLLAPTSKPASNSGGDDCGIGDRKAWISNRLQQLDELFAVSVGGFSTMDNHLHLLLRLDPAEASGWSDEMVVQRWFKLHPPRGTNRKPLPADQLQELVVKRLADPKWIAQMRGRLSSLSWFMKSLKEPLARLVNKAEKCTGAFFEGRFKSVAVLDEQALLAVAAYIDLNPVAAGLAATPEASLHTSVHARVEHVRQQDRQGDLRSALLGSLAGSRAAAGLEEQLWLIPIEDRRRLDSQREGMLEGFTLANYLLLVDCSGRMPREGKAAISPEAAEILSRLGSSAEAWQATLQRLGGGKRLIGRFIASSRAALNAVAQRLGVSRLANLSAAQ